MPKPERKENSSGSQASTPPKPVEPSVLKSESLASTPLVDFVKLYGLGEFLEPKWDLRGFRRGTSMAGRWPASTSTVEMSPKSSWLRERLEDIWDEASEKRGARQRQRRTNAHVLGTSSGSSAKFAGLSADFVIIDEYIDIETRKPEARKDFTRKIIEADFSKIEQRILAQFEEAAMKVIAPRLVLAPEIKLNTEAGVDEKGNLNVSGQEGTTGNGSGGARITDDGSTEDSDGCSREGGAGHRSGEE